MISDNFFIFTPYLAGAYLSLNSDVNDSVDGQRALHWASQTGSVTACRLLIQNGAEIAATNKHGRTALMMSVSGGFQDLTNYFLNFDLDLNARDTRGDTGRF